MEVAGPFMRVDLRNGLLLLARGGNSVYGFPFSALARGSIGVSSTDHHGWMVN